MSRSTDGHHQQQPSEKCNVTGCADLTGAPAGFNDKTHKGGYTPPYDRDGRYWLVPPFLIGASIVIIIYIVAHCIYLHCYAKKKMRTLAAARHHYPPAIVISDDPTSTGSYQQYTPIIQYNNSQDFVPARPYLVYQPFDDDEWERQLALRRPSTSAASSLRSSIKSQTGRSFTKLFGGKQRANSSCEDDGKRPPKRASLCFVPIGRSMSDPAATGGSNNEWTPLQGFVYMSRTQSCKSTASCQDNAPPLIIIGTNNTHPATAAAAAAAANMLGKGGSGGSSSSQAGSVGCDSAAAAAAAAVAGEGFTRAEPPIVSFSLEDRSSSGGDKDAALGDIKEEHELPHESQE